MRRPVPVIAGLLAVAAAIQIVAVHVAAVTALDARLLHALSSHVAPQDVDAVNRATNVMSGVLYVLLVALALVYAWRTRGWRIAAAGAVTVVGAQLTAQALKALL